MMKENNNKILKLNVDGYTYYTYKYVLLVSQYFKTLLDGDMHDCTPVNGSEIFIDRDGHLFENILNYLRTGRIYNDEGNGGLKELRSEEEYFQLEELSRMISVKLEASNKGTQEEVLLITADKVMGRRGSTTSGADKCNLFEDTLVYYRVLLSIEIPTTRSLCVHKCKKKKRDHYNYPVFNAIVAYMEIRLLVHKITKGSEGWH